MKLATIKFTGGPPQTRLVELNDALCEAAEQTETEILKSGGILELCRLRDTLAQEVLALRNELDTFQATSSAALQTAESSRAKLEHKVRPPSRVW
jgi:hypothetical protein